MLEHSQHSEDNLDIFIKLKPTISNNYVRINVLCNEFSYRKWNFIKIGKINLRPESARDKIENSNNAIQNRVKMR